jgi:CheY-like chemotaxis protein
MLFVWGDAITNLLFVDDSTLDVELAVRASRRDGLGFAWRQVCTENELIAVLQAGWPSVVLCDFTMPLLDGRQALKICRKLAPAVPFIFLSGTMRAEWADEAKRLGAVECVNKDDMFRVGAAIRSALAARIASK